MFEGAAIRATGGQKRALYAGAQVEAKGLPKYFENYFDSIPSSIVMGLNLVPSTAKRVLDVGCALGKTGRALKATRQVEVVGIEMITEAADVAREYLDDVLNVDLDELPDLGYPEDHFDTLLFFDIVEHLILPEAVLAHLLRWLKPGGSAIFSIPNVFHISVLAGLLGPAMRFLGNPITLPEHLRFYTLADMIELMDSLNLVIDGPVFGVGTEKNPLERAIGDAVAAMGGNRDRAEFESRVVQYVFRALPAPPGETAQNGRRDLSLEWVPNTHQPPSAFGLGWD